MFDEVARALVRNALAEDMGGFGDVTSAWTVPADLRGRAEVVAREALVLSGTPLALAVMGEVDRACGVTALVDEGWMVEPDQPVLALEGPVRWRGAPWPRTWAGSET